MSTRQTYLGRSYWVVKDPLTLNFYRFEDEEYTLLQSIDGRRSPADIQRQFEREYAPQRLALAQLQSLVSQLHRQGLVTSDIPGQGAQLLQRQRERAAQQRRAAWANLLSVRFPGVDPDRLLTWLNHRLGWLFAWPGAVLALILCSAACLLVTAQFDVFLRRLPAFGQFFGGSNWLLLAVVLAGTKVLHELGHGLACKRLGGECHEMGFMLLVFTPCLYCNVSDSWMVRSKWRRAAIGAAGMYVEVLLASLCTFLWWFSNPGLVHFLCLDVMFVCSVSTLLFNANPLLRYDGYFILADLMEIPNLRQKSSAVMQRTLGHWLLGLRPLDDPFLPQRRRAFFVSYALAAVVYRWIVLGSILWFLYRVFEPYGLQIVGQLLAVLALCSLVVMPLGQLVRFLHAPGRMRKVKKLRALLSTSIVAGLLATALCMPFPYHVVTHFTLQPRDATTVYVDTGGRLTEIHVQPGQQVRAGQTLLVLQNPQLEMTLARLEGQRDQLLAKRAALQLQAYDQESALLEMAEVAESIATLDQSIARREQELERLTIRAPARGGLCRAPDHRPGPSRDATLLVGPSPATREPGGTSTGGSGRVSPG